MRSFPRLILSAALPVLFFAALSPAEPAPSPSSAFAAGVAAYDANDVAAAADAFAALAAGPGAADVATIYNLGNAAYRKGDIGPAIHAYRTAQRLAPRDPDIRANLGFAAQTAGVSLPDYGFAATRLLSLSETEWRHLCRAAYLALFLLAAAALLFPAARRFFLPPAAAAVLLLALSLAGLARHRDFHRLPEWVLLAPVAASSAPLDASVELATLPAGTIVRGQAAHSGWVNIQSDGLNAWIPADAAKPVLP